MTSRSKIRGGLIAAALLVVTLAPAAQAANKHAEYVQGPIESGPQATAQCLQCHKEQAWTS